MKFNVSRSQAEIIEQELSRICSVLEGKNLRGRALEFMAVQSAQTPFVDTRPDEHPEDGPVEIHGASVKHIYGKRKRKKKHKKKDAA